MDFYHFSWETILQMNKQIVGQRDWERKVFDGVEKIISGGDQEWLFNTIESFGLCAHKGKKLVFVGPKAWVAPHCTVYLASDSGLSPTPSPHIHTQIFPSPCLTETRIQPVILQGGQSSSHNPKSEALHSGGWLWDLVSATVKPRFTMQCRHTHLVSVQPT